MLRNNLFVAYTAALLFLFSPSANAGFVVNVSEIGGDVFVEGAGNIDLTGLSLDPTNPSFCLHRDSAGAEATTCCKRYKTNKV